MVENTDLVTHIPSFRLIDRLQLQLLKRFPQIQDVDQIPLLLRAVERHDFGFIRATLPPRYTYIDDKTKKEFPYSRQIMLNVTNDNKGYRLARIPGIHVVTGYDNYGQDFDPFNSFNRILSQGFHGGPNMNVYLPSEDYMDTFRRFGYPGNPATGKTILTKQKEIENDSYRLLLWTGFSNNYLVTSETDTNIKEYGSGTVCHTPAARLQPFIILAHDSNIQQRLAFYNGSIGGVALSTPVIVLTHDFKEAGIIGNTITR